MKNKSKIGKLNTTILSNKDDSVSVILYNTEIIRHWSLDRKIRLDTGGYYTALTRRRMTECFHEWNIPIRVGFVKKIFGAETYNPENGETIEKYEFTRDDICYINY